MPTQPARPGCPSTTPHLHAPLHQPRVPLERRSSPTARARRRPTEGQPSTHPLGRKRADRAARSPANVISLRFRHRDSKKTRASVGGVGRRTTDGPLTPRRRRAITPKPQRAPSRPALPGRRVWRVRLTARAKHKAPKTEPNERSETPSGTIRRLHPTVVPEPEPAREGWCSLLSRRRSQSAADRCKA